MSSVPKLEFARPEILSNPESYYSELRKHGPVFRGRIPILGKTWIATSWESCNAVLKDPKRFPREGQNAGRRRLPGIQWWMPKPVMVLAKNMLAFDGDRHRRLRTVVDGAFQRRNISAMEPRLEEICTKQLDTAQSAGSASSNGFEFVSAFARPYPLTVICELLGLPLQDREKFSRWFNGFSHVKSAWGIVKLIPSLWKVLRYLRQKYRDNSDLESEGLINELKRERENPLSEDEFVAMIFLLLVAGHETTVHLLSALLYQLDQHPTQKSLLENDIELMENAVQETLRFHCPVQFAKPRFVSQDGEFFGAQLKQGEMIMPFLAMANRDPSQFDQPNVFQIEREPNHHLGFGTGPHVCLGMKLAVAESKIAVQKLFARLPDWRLTDVEWIQRFGIRGFSKLGIAGTRS